ncbi:hypothetical protein [Okeania sp. SIO2C2]|uniref:hypothetical protein n=1 Tax=Okeania sp. SIO2C2 TaxID=2607787 RepID=UPI002580D193|nr:hypothetical protein [Okeania sp. SIO2C2]
MAGTIWFKVRKKEEGRRKKEEGRRKKEEGGRRKEEVRRRKEIKYDQKNYRKIVGMCLPF